MVGYRIQNIDNINSVYICSHCSLLLRDAVQSTECGHRLCQSCFDEQEGDMISCFGCPEKISREHFRVDRACRNEMKNLEIICTYCNWTGALKNYENHLNQNHSNPSCKFCEEIFSSVNDLNQHQKYNCNKIILDCPLNSLGCEGQFSPANRLQHLLSYQHQLIVSNFVCQNSKKNPNPLVNNFKNHLEEIYRTTNILSDGIRELNNDIERLNSESIQYQNTLKPIIADLRTIQKTNDEQNIYIDKMKIDQETFNQDISFMKQQFENMTSNSYDGTLLWKITNVKEKIAASQSETPVWIYSSPFYTSPTGYKMCLRLNLNGDEDARKTHMSLSFILMRGDYDAILHFPFCFKILFYLFDQTGQQTHIAHVLTPDVLSNNFQRSQSDMTVAGGILRFVPLTKFQQENNPYIIDNTMFIKAMILFKEIPPTVLSYVLNIHPGFTIQNQFTMIQEETERQNQISNFSTTNNTMNQSMDMDLQQNNIVSNISTDKKIEHTNSNNNDRRRIKR